MTNIESIGAATSTAATAAAPATKAEAQKNQFLQLLVAQLKGQNPLDPLDGTQFVSQLAQFSSLEELVGIHSALDNLQKSLQPSTSKTGTNPQGVF